MVEEAKQRFGERSILEAEALELLARGYKVLGREPEDAAALEHSITIREDLLGKTHASLIAPLALLGEIYGRNPSTEVQREKILRRLTALREAAVGPEGTVEALSELTTLLMRQRKVAEALELAGLAQSRLGRTGSTPPPGVAAAVHERLAGVLIEAARTAEAVPLLRTALESEGASSPGNSVKSQRFYSIQVSLALALEALGPNIEAEDIWRSRLGPWQQNPNDLLQDLAWERISQGRQREFLAIARRIEAAAAAPGADRAGIASRLYSLALASDREGYSEWETDLHHRALALRRMALDPHHLSIADSIEHLAWYWADELKEPLYQELIEILENQQVRDMDRLRRALDVLAGVKDRLGKKEEAAALSRRSAALLEQAYGAGYQGDPDDITSLNQTANDLLAQGRYEQAERTIRRLIFVTERTFGSENHFSLLEYLNLGNVYRGLKRPYDEEAAYRHAADTAEKASFSKQFLDEGLLQVEMMALKALADFYSEHGRKASQYNALDRAAKIAAAIVKRYVLAGKIPPRDGRNMEWSLFARQVAVGFELAEENPERATRLLDETFQLAQRAALSHAELALSQTGARLRAGSPTLAAALRQRQDLTPTLDYKEAELQKLLLLPAAQRDKTAAAELRIEISRLQGQIDAVTAVLERDATGYADLFDVAPVSVTAARQFVHQDEALVLFFSTPDVKDTYGWLVTNTELRRFRAGASTGTLADMVGALRCGLDESELSDASGWPATTDAEKALKTGQERRRERCRAWLKTDYTPGSTPGSLPFDLGIAHELYLDLFGQIAPQIAGKQLLIVPSGALTQLPLQVLVTAAPANGDYKTAAWLARDHAITILPAVSSLRALRRVSKPSAAQKPMIGFGNPLLDGQQNDERFGDAYKALARRALEKQRCPETLWGRVASLFGLRRGVPQIQTRGGLADVALVREQSPLPETADELCAVARDVGADASDIYLGQRATEREVKRLSASGELAKYRIVHFATHGALAGQIVGNTEPGLLLTPPESPSEEDDGYLTASEIAGLKLDADWVILSACNTAAGGAQGAEALSGLARAFIYAQARALLVSHWEVNSAATVKLITGAMSRLAANKSMGRGEAMRQSMLALIDKGEPHETHPAFWAPFVVVGEGAAGR